jgi:hypothetical protein
MTVLGRDRMARFRAQRAKQPARAGALSRHLRFGLPVRLWIGLLVLSAVIPILELINIAFKSAEGFQEHPLGIGGLTLANISAAWTQGDYLRGYLISGGIGISVAIVVTLTASSAGYALVFLKFRGKEILFGWYLTSMALPLAMFLVPLFVAYRRIGLMDNGSSARSPPCSSGRFIPRCRLRYGKARRSTGRANGGSGHRSSCPWPGRCSTRWRPWSRSGAGTSSSSPMPSYSLAENSQLPCGTWCSPGTTPGTGQPSWPPG